MFDNHLTVESPGMLPGLVRTNNIREIHFSRNPKIFEFLREYEYVKEFGEGVDRMFREMEAAGLPAPEYRTVEFMVYATLKNQKWGGAHVAFRDVSQDAPPKISPNIPLKIPPRFLRIAIPKEAGLLSYCAVPRSQREMLGFWGLSDRKHFRKKYLKPLLDAGKLRMTIPEKSNSRNQKYVKV